MTRRHRPSTTGSPSSRGGPGAQRTLADHAEAVLAAGVPVFPEAPDDVVGWVTDLVEGLGALPADDPRRPTDEETALVADGLDRIREAAAVLAGSGMPSTLQHNDLHLANAFRRPGGGTTCIDLGDAVWAHPITTLRDRVGRRRRGCGSLRVRRRPLTTTASVERRQHAHVRPPNVCVACTRLPVTRR